MNHVIIDPKYCKGCLLCLDACKFGCLELSGKTNDAGFKYVRFIDGSNCKGCLSCRTVCPDVAITVYKEQ